MFSQLWMGTHPNAPSTLVSAGNGSLADWIKEHPGKLGNSVNQKFNGALPFLFKVLSVNKALSIQAHPNKVQCCNSCKFTETFVKTVLSRTCKLKKILR